MPSSRKEIPPKARKHRSIRKARGLIISENILWLPVDPFCIYEQSDWLLYEYKEARKELRVSDPLKLRKTGSEARTSKPRGSSSIITVYDSDIIPFSRIRYTLAHEIGHIVLGHLDDFECTAINRGGLTKKEYGVLEDEADFFAAELLCPIAIFKAIGAWDRDEIIRVCDISKRAAFNRSRDLAWWGHKAIAFEADTILKNQFRDYLILINVCTNTYNLPPIANLIKKNPEVTKLTNKLAFVETNMNNRFICCPRCGNNIFSKDANYCKMCGIYLYNDCTNEQGGAHTYPDECGIRNSGDARFCEKCGSPTRLYERGLLMSWEDVLEAYGEIAAGLEQKADSCDDFGREITFSGEDLPF